MSPSHPNSVPNRREAMKLGLSAASFAMVSPHAIASTRASSKPNILMIIADQHRADCLGIEGNRAVQTPNLDWIGSSGARFTQAYTCTPSCTPARAALLTGMSPWNNGMLGYGRLAVEYPVEMPRVLCEAGYYTTGIGKMHWHPQRNLHGFHQTILDESGRAEAPEFKSDYRCWLSTLAPHLDPDATGIGWNDYRAKVYALPEQFHPTSWTGRTAVNFIRTYNRPEPFFLKVSFARPHSPYDPPQRLMERYRDADIPPAAVGKWAERYAPVLDRNDFNLWRGDLGADQVRRSRQGYYGSVHFIDEQIGRILETLEGQGRLEDTLILYFSDHGDMLGDQHHWRKSYAYEGSARIPMMIRWPEGMLSAPRGQDLSQPVELRDVLPTLADAAGTRVEHERMDGLNMLNLIRGQTEGWREYIDLEHDQCYERDNHWSGLTDGKYKYIYHAVTGEEQLFHIASDPYELNDLASEPASTRELQTWRSRLIAHLEPRGEHYVQNGRLAVRNTNVKYSPHHPKDPEPAS